MRLPFFLHHTHDSGHDSMSWLGSLQPMYEVLSSDAGCMGFLTPLLLVPLTPLLLLHWRLSIRLLRSLIAWYKSTDKFRALIIS